MGTWGEGPFDSDGALDELGWIADQVGASQDGDGNLRLPAGGHAAAAALVEQRLTRSDESERYALIGLVAARLAEVPEMSSGTNLLSRIESDDVRDYFKGVASLTAHCGYVALLTLEDAERLRPLALAQIESLVERTGDFSNPVTALEALDSVRAALAG